MCPSPAELPEPAVVTSRAASGSPRSVRQPAVADTQVDDGGHAGGLDQPEQGEDLSDMMTARHVSIKER